MSQILQVVIGGLLVAAVSGFFWLAYTNDRAAGRIARAIYAIFVGAAVVGFIAVLAYDFGYDAAEKDVRELLERGVVIDGLRLIQLESGLGLGLLWVFGCAVVGLVPSLILNAMRWANRHDKEVAESDGPVQDEKAD